MKTLEVSEEIFRKQFDNCDYYDDDCTCFGMDVDGKMYLYNEGEVDGYWLTIFEKPLCELLCDDSFVAKLAIEVVKHSQSTMCDFCGFIADCMNGDFNIDKRPFELRYIIYAFCY